MGRAVVAAPALRRRVSLAGRGGRGAGGGTGEAAGSDPLPAPPGPSRPARPQRGGGFSLPQAPVSALVVVSEQAGEFRSVVALSERCEAGGGARRPAVSRPRGPRLGGSGWRRGS